VLNILMPKVALQRARIDSIIRELEAASVPEHVRMDLDAELRPLGSSVALSGKFAAPSGASRANFLIFSA
jgi:hypothetical protein